MAISEDVVVHMLVRERTKLIAFIRSIIPDHRLAEDVFQDLCVLVLKSREQIESEKHLLSWMRTVARHKALNQLRDELRRPRVIDDDLLESLESKWRAYDEVDVSELTDVLTECVKKLSPYGQRLIELRYRDGLTGRRLAEVLNRKVETVYVALTRVHRALSNCMGRATNQQEGLP